MKKRLPYILISIIYIVSLGFGFGFAGLRRVAAKAPPVTDTRQANWIVVRVDDMSLEYPQLVSIWGLFFSFSPGPQVFFKPIYSFDQNIERKSDFARLYSVTPDRALSENFVQGLDRLNIRRSGLVILDNEGFRQFNAWFQQPVEVARPMGSPPGQISAGSIEANSYQQICSTLESPDTARPHELPWQNLFPLHLISRPSLESLINLWARVVDSNITPHCEVMPVQ